MRTASLVTCFSGRHAIHALAILVVASASVWLTACSSGIEKGREAPDFETPDMEIIDVPTLMRGTVSSRAVMIGYADRTSPTYQPLIVRGYGLVVGLDGTGSRNIPPSVRAHMIAEMSKNGIGSAQSGWSHLKPEEMLDSNDTAVVVVEGIVPQAAVGRLLPPPGVGLSRGGAIEGTRFDVRVLADPRTGTTSLEGGRLYTTELRPGPLTTGSRQPKPVATAGGPIFVNPFAEPGAINSDAVTRHVGRVLDGGEVLRDLSLKLSLVNPSHTSVRLVEDAVNQRFPRESGQSQETARGKSASVIDITVPPSYKHDTEEFVEILRYTTIRQVNGAAIAGSTKRHVLAHPYDYEAAYWRWLALGEVSLPYTRELYDSAEELPRLASIRAGAKLGDPIVIDALKLMSIEGTSLARLEAAELLERLPLNPRVDNALRDMLSDEELEVRLRAYEALAARRDPSITRISMGDKFDIDIVPSLHPMIYITQSGRPRIAVFSPDTQISQEVLLQAWSGRFMIRDASNSEEDDVEVYFRELDETRGETYEVDRSLIHFIQFLAHRTTIESPDPGLDMTYGETVGALHLLWRQGYLTWGDGGLAVDFKAEQDRVLATIRRFDSDIDYTERPDFPVDENAPEPSRFMSDPPPAGETAGSGDATP